MSLSTGSSEEKNSLFAEKSIDIHIMNVSRQVLVSVIIPTYNRAHLLKRSIYSVLSQSYTNLELLVVDDASTDNTQDIVSQIDDKRLRYIRCKSNKGGAAARNIGIKEAQGELLAFQDSDDEWLWGKIEKQVEAFHSSGDNVGVVYTGFLRWENKIATYIPNSNIETKEGNIIKQIFHGNFVSTQTLMVKREFFQKAGVFDETLPRFQDWELVIRLADVCAFKFIDEPLVMVYSTPDSITSNNAAAVTALDAIYDKNLLFLIDHPKLLSAFLYNLGHYNCANGNIKAGQAYFITALKSNPRNTKTYIAFITSLFGCRAYTYFYLRYTLFSTKN